MSLPFVGKPTFFVTPASCVFVTPLQASARLGGMPRALRLCVHFGGDGMHRACDEDKPLEEIL